jgi:hypothetical protein
MKRTFCATLLLFGLVGDLLGGTVTLIDPTSPANDYRIAAVADVDIEGTLYDATFYHGTTFAAFATTPGVVPITFFDSESARAAVSALATAIGTIRTPYLQSEAGVFTSNFYIPFTVTLTPPNPLTVTYALGSATVITSPPFLTFDITYSRYLDDRSASLDFFIYEDNAFVAFISKASAVPEPGMLTIIGLLAGMVVSPVLRRRCQAAARAI